MAQIVNKYCTVPVSVHIISVVEDLLKVKVRAFDLKLAIVHFLL